MRNLTAITLECDIPPQYRNMYYTNVPYPFIGGGIVPNTFGVAGIFKMEFYAVASFICAASLAGYLVLFHLYGRVTKRLKLAEATLAAGHNGVSELIAENIELSRHLERLQKAEIDLYELRREHARTSSNLQHMARVETGLRLEIARLRQTEQAQAAARSSDDLSPIYSPQAA
jgi:hypothetical protein